MKTMRCKTVKSLIRGAALLVLLALVLSACGGGRKADPDAGEESGEVREEVLFTEKEVALPEYTAEPEPEEEAVRILDGQEKVKGKGDLSLSVRSNLDPKKPMIALTFDDGPSAYTMDIMALLEKYGASRLSEIKEEDYAALMKDAEEIG